MSNPTQQQREKMEAAAFRKLVQHLRHRTDVQNVDLMGQSGFCRNCLADWYAEAAADLGHPMDKDAARTAIYGMSPAEWKQRHQTPASEAQLALMAESLKKNEGRGF
ncbi:MULTISPECIES: DUF1244 domain-containing protein [unclassified Iodidimonas]|jgi:hypothetical protein|uniref:DUF1244 domain-containing protein n=1 Tax=unclassified Iodidimonas TaxID=2626145 RepID=UPI0024827F9B|nr:MULTISPECIES: DUF1244 domain-containing protein [unclassified Iodidimonas]